MPVITNIVNRFNSSRLKQIGHFRKFPVDIQQATFVRLLKIASETEWGRKYGYSSISSVKEYQSRVPVQTYEDLIPYIDRLGKGESDLLWPGRVRWVAKTPGPT